MTARMPETSGTEKSQQSNHKTLSGRYKHPLFHLLYAITEVFYTDWLKSKLLVNFAKFLQNFV